MGGKKNVAITGISGFLGKHLAKAFVDAGYFVCGLSRKEYNPGYDNYRWKYFDLENPDTYKGLDLEKFDVIVHNAGLVATANPGKFWTVNAVGTANLVYYLEDKNYEGKFIHVSTLAVYGPGEHSYNDESFFPISEYGRSKLFGETIVKRSSLKWNIIRPPVVFGEFDVGLKGIVKLFSKGIGIKWDKPKVISLTYVGNLVEAIVCLSETTHLHGAYTIRDVNITWEQMASEVCRSLGREVKVWLPLTNNLLKLVFYPMILYGCLVGGHSFYNKDKLTELLADKWVYSDTNIESIGYNPKFEFSTSLRRSLSWYLK